MRMSSVVFSNLLSLIIFLLLVYVTTIKTYRISKCWTFFLKKKTSKIVLSSRFDLNLFLFVLYAHLPSTIKKNEKQRKEQNQKLKNFFSFIF